MAPMWSQQEFASKMLLACSSFEDRLPEPMFTQAQRNWGLGHIVTIYTGKFSHSI